MVTSVSIRRILPGLETEGRVHERDYPHSIIDFIWLIKRLSRFSHSTRVSSPSPGRTPSPTILDTISLSLSLSLSHSLSSPSTSQVWNCCTVHPSGAFDQKCNLHPFMSRDWNICELIRATGLSSAIIRNRRRSLSPPSQLRPVSNDSPFIRFKNIAVTPFYGRLDSIITVGAVPSTATYRGSSTFRGFIAKMIDRSNRFPVFRFSLIPYRTQFSIKKKVTNNVKINEILQATLVETRTNHW